MHFLRCSLVISVTKTFPLPFFNTQIFILKLLFRVYMKHCQTTKKEIWIQVQPKYCYELFWLLTIWCGTQALMLSLWLIDLVSTHVAQRGPTTGPFCTPHSILKSRFFFQTTLSFIHQFLFIPICEGFYSASSGSSLWARTPQEQQGKLVWQSRASQVDDHLCHSHDLSTWFRGDIVRRNYILVILEVLKVKYSIKKFLSCSYTVFSFSGSNW